MMNKIKQFAKRIKATYIELHALDSAKLIRFYKSNGYRHIMPPCATTREKHFEIDDDGVNKLKAMTLCLDK